MGRQQGWPADADLDAFSRGVEDRGRPCQHHRRSQILKEHGSNKMSLDDLPTRSPQPGNESEPAVRRVDRPSTPRDKVTRAEELRLQLADEIVRGVLAPGSG